MSSLATGIADEGVMCMGTRMKIIAARQHIQDGNYDQAVYQLEEALKEEGDSHVLWGELATALYGVWHQLMTQYHNPRSNASIRGGVACADNSILGGAILQRAYNAFIVAMEFPANKTHPPLLLKLVMIYFEFRAYQGALSVCTLLVEGYPQQSSISEAIFLSAVSAKALQKRRDGAKYFLYLADNPPFKLSAYHMYLLAALELEKVDGARDSTRETYSQAYKHMIKLVPVTHSEKAAHHGYKTSHKNENQRAQMWIQDYATWIDLATKLAALNFPLLVCDIFDATRGRRHYLEREHLILEGVCRYRIGESHRALEVLTAALSMNYWCDHCRYLLQLVSDTWRIRFDKEDATAKLIQCTMRRHWKRAEWRVAVQKLRLEKHNRKALVIQLAWKRFFSRLQLASQAKSRREQEETESVLIANEDWLCILRTLNSAALKLQSLHRIFTAKREVRLRLAIREKKNSLLATLAARRSRSSKKLVFEVWHQFIDIQKHNREEAACLIQRNLRAFLGRQIFYRLLLVNACQKEIVLACLNRRALIVKSHAMNEWRQFASQRREIKHQACHRIQQTWRRHLNRKRYKHELRRHVLATEAMHGLLADKRVQRLRTTWITLAANALYCRSQKLRCAIVIQRHARGLIARKKVRILRSERRRVAIIVNKMASRSTKRLLRAALDGLVNFLQVHKNVREASAVIAQRVYRGYLARKRVRFLAECNRILREPRMTLCGKPAAYIKRVCFLLIARLPEQNRMERLSASNIIQKWYRSRVTRLCLRTSLDKLRRQRAILNTLQANFLTLARLFVQELKTRVQAKRWRRNLMARRIQRVVVAWLTYRRYCRLLNLRELQETRLVHFAHQKQFQLTKRLFTAWRANLLLERQKCSDAARCIQRTYRMRRAKRKTQRALDKSAARARLLDSVQLKPFERCFREWEGLVIDRYIMMVQRAAKSAGGIVHPAKWRAAMMKTDSVHRRVVPFETIEEQAKLPSLLFYTLLNRVRQTGILQLSLVSVLPTITTCQLRQLCGFASSIIVDGGGKQEPHLVELVVDSMASTEHPCPTQKLIFYNSRLSPGHTTTLRSMFKRPDTRITSLVLSNIELSNVAVVTLATSICHGHSKLEQVVLEACGIGSAGASAIAEALCHSRLLWKLDLSHNRIGDSACPALAQALATSESLRVVALSGNAFSDRGVVRHLAPALRRVMDASRLECVVLRQLPRISRRGRDALQQATSRLRLAVHVD